MLVAPSCGFSALQRAEIAEIDAQVTFAIDDADVSVLFNEPKLLKLQIARLQQNRAIVSVLFNEPKLLKLSRYHCAIRRSRVSVLFNEPKLLKFCVWVRLV